MSIRTDAVLAIQRLQDPRNERCPVVKAYLDCLLDNQATVRNIGTSFFSQI